MKKGNHELTRNDTNCKRFDLALALVRKGFAYERLVFWWWGEMATTNWHELGLGTTNLHEWTRIIKKSIWFWLWWEGVCVRAVSFLAMRWSGHHEFARIMKKGNHELTRNDTNCKRFDLDCTNWHELGLGTTNLHELTRIIKKSIWFWLGWEGICVRAVSFLAMRWSGHHEFARIMEKREPRIYTNGHEL